MSTIINFFKGIVDTVVVNFGFDSIGDFMSSMVHAKLLLWTLPSSVVLFAFVEQWLGITSAIFIAFGVMAIMELITGLVSAKKQGHKWSSRKFSRFGLKILVWLSLIMVANSFKISYEELEGLQNYLIYQMFNWIHGVLVVYVSLEYMISILENFSKITGKKENKFLGFLKKKLDQILGVADEMTNPNRYIGKKDNETPQENDLDSPEND